MTNNRIQRFEIGETVTFKHGGTTQEGRVRGVELVHDPRKRIGWHFIIETSDYEIHDVHQDDIGGVVELATA